jgi:hypothetical protein
MEPDVMLCVKIDTKKKMQDDKEEAAAEEGIC